MINIIPNWHPVFVHFSVGLLLTAALFHVMAVFAGKEPLKQTLTHVANWNLWVGTVITLFTVAAGWMAFNTVDHDTPSHLAMIEHRNWAMVTFAAFLAIGIWSFFRAKQQAPIQWPLVIAVCAAGALLISTAWHGGELVYRHGLGVMSLPNPDEHAHGEGAAHDHGHDGHDHDQQMKQPPGEMDQNAASESTEPVSPEAESTSQTQSGHSHEPGHEHHDHEH